MPSQRYFSGVLPQEPQARVLAWAIKRFDFYVPIALRFASGLAKAIMCERAIVPGAIADVEDELLVNALMVKSWAIDLLLSGG